MRGECVIPGRGSRIPIPTPMFPPSSLCSSSARFGRRREGDAFLSPLPYTPLYSDEYHTNGRLIVWAHIYC